MITHKQIQKLVKVIVDETDADTVYLFGSQAINEGKEHSDADFIIILKEITGKEHRRKVASGLGLKTAIPDFFFPKDFKIYSQKEFNELKNNKNSFLYHILQTAKPLYVRQQKH